MDQNNKQDNIIDVEAEEVEGSAGRTVEDTATNSSENIGPILEPEINKGFFDKMSTGGKKIMSMAYEGVYNIPVVNRAVAKMEIAYNQFWIDKKENKSVKLKGELDAINLKSGIFNQSKEEITSLMEDLKREGNPGHESLQMKIKEIEKEEAKIANKKDSLQSKIEKKENKIKLYTNKRDGVADKIIGRYEKKLSPIKDKMEKLENYRDRLDLFVAATEAKHEEQIIKLDILRERKINLEQKFMAMGQSERQIKRDTTIKLLSEQIESGYQKIELEKLSLSARSREINNKIAKVDSKAKPYRDRKDQFIRIKDRRPIKIDLEERSNLDENKTIENTSTHTRTERKEGKIQENTNSHQATIENNYTSSGFEKMPPISDHILSYNEYLKKEGAETVLQVNQNELLKATQLSSNIKITQKKFREIISKYYKVKKIPENKYLNLLNNIK